MTAPLDRIGTEGYGTVEVFGPDGVLKASVEFTNIVTDVGDAYYAARAIQGVGPAAPAGPTLATGLQVGSDTATPAAKTGAGAAMVAFLAGQAFDPDFPVAVPLGAGLGVNASYRTTFAAGTATGTISEIVITNGPVDTAATAAVTLSRAVLATGTVKGEDDSLAVTYNVRFLG